MGRMQAEEMKDQLGLDQALSWHLRSNHYPPVPLTMLPVCREAIDHANCGDWDTEINLPKGISFRGEKFATVSQIVRAHHLDTFLEDSNG